MSKLKHKIIPFVFPILLIILWEILIALEFVKTSSLNARPTDIIIRFYGLFFDEEYTDKQILLNIWISLKRLFIGVVVGSFLGIVLAYFNSKFEKLRLFTNPTLTVIGPIPIIIWIPVFIMLFAGDDSYKIGLVAFGTFLLIYLNMFTSFNSISKKYIELGRIYEKNYWEIFRSIYFPNGLGTFLTSLRFSIAIGWIVLFVVEYSNSPSNTGGLGYLIQDFRYTGKTEEMFASVLILAIISYVLDRIITIIMKFKLKWTDNIKI